MDLITTLRDEIQSEKKNLREDLDSTLAYQLGRLYVLMNELDQKIEAMISGWAPLIAPGVWLMYAETGFFDVSADWVPFLTSL